MTEVVINPSLLALMAKDETGPYVTVTKTSSKEVEVSVDGPGKLKLVIERSLYSKSLKDATPVGSKWYIDANGGIASVVVPVQETTTKSNTRNSSSGSLPIRATSKLNV